MVVAYERQISDEILILLQPFNLVILCKMIDLLLFSLFIYRNLLQMLILERKTVLRNF